MGFYDYYIEHDLDAALRKFLAAAEALPSDGEVLASAAFIWRRQGKFKEGVARLKKAFELDPRDASLAGQIGEFLSQMKDYPQALRYLDTAIGLAPEPDWPYLEKAMLYVLWKGDRVESRRILEALPTAVDKDHWTLTMWFNQSLYDRRFSEALDYVEMLPDDWVRGQQRAYPREYLEGQALQLLGERDSALSAFDAARIAIEAELANHPDDFRLHSSLGLALAGLGRKNEAISAGRRAVELQPVSRDAYIGPDHIEILADICLARRTGSGGRSARVSAVDPFLHVGSIAATRSPLGPPPRPPPLPGPAGEVRAGGVGPVALWFLAGGSAHFSRTCRES